MKLDIELVLNWYETRPRFWYYDTWHQTRVELVLNRTKILIIATLGLFTRKLYSVRAIGISYKSKWHLSKYKWFHTAGDSAVNAIFQVRAVNYDKICWQSYYFSSTTFDSRTQKSNKNRSYGDLAQTYNIWPTFVQIFSLSRKKLLWYCEEVSCPVHCTLQVNRFIFHKIIYFSTYLFYKTEIDSHPCTVLSKFNCYWDEI